MQIREVFAVARKHRWIVIGVFVLTVGLAAAFAFTKPENYEASATIAMFPSTAKGQGFLRRTTSRRYSTRAPKRRSRA